MNASDAATQLAADSRSRTPVFIAICCLVVILSLAVGVGLASNLVIRHLVQTAPVWIAVALGLRRSRATSWAALPVLLFWLLLMTVIWLYLLGVSHLISGHFSPVEIAMTITVGVASVFGIASCLRFKSSLSPAIKAAVLVLMGIAQFVCFRLSLLPAIAHH